ncbi:hypothetical protein [Lentilactobacillus hilgardii]|uniref:hypothetical protein n=1 Tax=Lentilactobacillus hilgardii TaxID=1588 RepID=UPI003FA6007B
MIKVIVAQFKNSYKQWGGVLALLSISAVMIGFCFNGSVSVFSLSKQTFLNAHNPLPIFILPLVFGGITLIIISSGVIKLAIVSLQKEYVLWSLLGTSPLQLTLLIGGQLFLIGSVSGIIGYILSLPLGNFLYSILQKTVGKSWLPSIPMNPSLIAIFITILLTAMLAFACGFIHANSIFKEVGILRGKEKHSHDIGFIVKVLIIVGCLFLLFKNYTALSFASKGIQAIIAKGQVLHAASFYVANLLSIALLLMILFGLTAKEILPFLIHALFITPFGHKVTGPKIAGRMLIYQKHYLGSLIVPFIITSILLTDTLFMTLGIPGNNGAQNSSGTLVTFIVYVSAPLIIVLANIFSVMLMVTNKEQQINHQLRILGTNTTQLVATVFYKAFICGIVTVIWGSLFNSILYLALYKISLLVRSPAKLNIWSIFYFPVASSILSFSFILMIGCYSITKSHHLRE